MSYDRRHFLKGSGVALGAVAACPAWAEESLPLRKTPPDAEGPFYPTGDRSQDNEDLLRNMSTPRGATLRFSGRVVDVQSQPQEGLIIDIWHADTQGRYKHPDDRSSGARFEDFAYWGKVKTNSDGTFSFRTYVPGTYGGRPSHIHYIVWKGDKRLLTSQVYFRGFEERSGAAIESERHDLRKAKLVRANATDFATDFRVVV